MTAITIAALVTIIILLALGIAYVAGYSFGYAHAIARQMQQIKRSSSDEKEQLVAGSYNPPKESGKKAQYFPQMTDKEREELGDNHISKIKETLIPVEKKENE